MYKNVGEKIKSIAKVCAIIFMMIAGVVALIVFTTIFKGGGVFSFVLFLLSCFNIFLGWLCGIGLYAFGHLIVTLDDQLKQQENMVRLLKKNQSNQLSYEDDTSDIVLPNL